MGIFHVEEKFREHHFKRAKARNTGFSGPRPAKASLRLHVAERRKLEMA
jgi:hypothetical protein